MSEGVTRSKTISRRSLLKIGALTAGSLNLPRATGQTDPESRFDAEVKSCCQFCQARCTTLVQVRNGRVVNVYGDPGNFWTEGGLCPKGQAVVELTYSPHRLLYPLRREGSGWKRISYSEAVNLVAEKILKLKSESPEDFAHQVVMFAPLWESRESELMATMAMKLSGFPDIYHPGDTCIGNSGAALELCLGSAINSTTIDEFLNSELLVLWGVNVAETYPVYTRWIDKARARGTKVLYIDPRRTPTSNHCDWQVLPRPGTDGALALGLIRLILQKKLHDRTFVENCVNGFHELADACDSYTPEKVAGICCLSEEQIRELAVRCGSSQATIVWLGASLSRYTNAIQSVRAMIALPAITGNLSGPGKGMMNVQGGKPGGGEAFDQSYSSPDLPPALGFRKALYNMERKRVKVLFLNSSYRRYSDANRVKKAIGEVEFVLYRGFFMDEEAKLAHLIIPATMTFESAGAQYGNQRQVVWRNKAVPRLGETVEDWQFYRDLGKRIHADRFPSVDNEEDIYELFRKSDPSWTGLTLERLKKDASGISWPCPSVDHQGTKGTLYPEGRFLTPSGKVELSSRPLGPIQWTEPEGSPFSDPEIGKAFPLTFIQGKVVHHWQQTLTNWSAYMAQFSEGNYIQVHPKTVQDMQIQDGDWVYLETQSGKIKSKVRISELIMPGVVWTPSHPEPGAPYQGNAGESINAIIPSAWDRVGAQFNGFACRLTKV